MNLRNIRMISARQHKEGKCVAIDFSSPNIAKPFHFGHLKSTILGNFLANLHKYYGNKVIRINYIGDWGVQYGLLSLGLEELKSQGKLNEFLEDKNKLNRLLEIYVNSNKRGQEDQVYYDMAKQHFKAMDCDQDEEQLLRWRQIRDISLSELKQSYNRLGVEFDVFEYESDYVADARHIVARMQSLGLAKAQDAGQNQSYLATTVLKNAKLIDVPIQKSDGSTLYITRDIAAAISRKNKYNFDKMLYVVGSDQEKHFHCLREIIKKLDCHWADDLIHVKMGKVIGMSSRSGKALLLSDILSEAAYNYMKSTRDVPTSKVSDEADIEEVGQQLALSALFVFDMRNKRTKNYEFGWNQVMVPGERSGIHLQTTYARLCSLLNKARLERNLRPYNTVEEINYDSICCIEGVHLINVMNDLERKLDESYQALDPSPLVNHSLLLCKAANRARKSDWLHVINEPDTSKALSRLTLFESARSQIEFIILMLGLKPLARV
jgi:arginyl-tRNA synthetase